MENASNLYACNCFAARQAARHLTKLYERHLAGAGLTSAQFSILVALSEKSGMTMAELASALVMDRTTLLRAMKPLQREQLIGTTANPNGTRQLVFALLPAAERKLKQAARLWQNAQDELEAQIGASKAARLRRDLLALSQPA